MDSSAEYLTPDDVADILKCNAKTVIRLCRSGEIRHFKLGKLYRVRRDWITEYVDGSADSNKSSNVAVQQSIDGYWDAKVRRLQGGKPLTRTGF